MGTLDILLIAALVVIGFAALYIVVSGIMTIYMVHVLNKDLKKRKK